MKPTIIFNRASPQYEAQLIKYGINGAEYVMPPDEMYERKIAALKDTWSEWGPKVLDELHAITQLEWLERDIRCYVVSGTKSSFSHPLTLKLYASDEKMFDVLVHELIHRLLNNPLHPDEHRALRKKFMEPHLGENMVVKNHILLHAIHAQVVLNLFGQERLDRILSMVQSPDYLRAWEIVHERGRAEILKEVFNYL